MDFGEKERFGSRERKILSRRSENEMNPIAPHYIQKTTSWWIKDLSGICRALNLDRNEFVEVLLRICWRQKECLGGSRICWESIEQTVSIEIWLNGSKKLSSRNPEISMDWEAVEMVLRRQRAQENSMMDRESFEDLLRKEKDKLDRKESIEDLSRSCQAWRKGVFQGGKNTRR